MTTAVLFDLGGTLVEYFGREEFPAILREAIGEVESCLRARGLLRSVPEATWEAAQGENRESSDARVRPLADRLARIFQLSGTDLDEELSTALCRAFLRPIFARGHLYEDAVPTLVELRQRGIRTAIVSNTTWGSPGSLWRKEVARHGLLHCVDQVVFCTDVGWRKPDPRIFHHALQRLRARPEDCLFVGDDPRWDLVGPRGMGMEAVLIARPGRQPPEDEAAISHLRQLWGRLDGA